MNSEGGVPDVLVMLPAYNEAENISNVLDGIFETVEQIDAEFEVLVIDDGSADETARRVRAEGASLVSHKKNLGPGVAVRTGYKYAYRNGFDYVVRLDGDGQHPSEMIPDLLSPLFADEADVVLGSRYLSDAEYSTSLLRHFGINGYSRLVSFLTGQRITDVTSGFRAMDIDVIRDIVDHFSTGMNMVHITTIQGRKFRLEEIPVPMQERDHGNSYLNINKMLKYPFHSAYHVTRVLFKEG